MDTAITFSLQEQLTHPSATRGQRQGVKGCTSFYRIVHSRGEIHVNNMIIDKVHIHLKSISICCLIKFWDEVAKIMGSLGHVGERWGLSGCARGCFPHYLKPSVGPHRLHRAVSRRSRTDSVFHWSVSHTPFLSIGRRHGPRPSFPAPHLKRWNRWLRSRSGFPEISTRSSRALKPGGFWTLNTDCLKMWVDRVRSF